MSTASKPMSQRQAARFMRILAEATPEPRTELVFGNPYQLLVAVVLSAQATDKGVNAVTQQLFAKVKDPAGMLRLGHSRVEKHLRTLGLFRSKARYVMGLSELLLERHAGAVPCTRKELQALPGVGRKTANVVLNSAFGEPTLAVDTHVFRVGNRTGLAPGKNPREVEDGLVATIPSNLLRHAHHWLILHGRYTCTARQPKCPQCMVRKLCLHPAKTPA